MAELNTGGGGGDGKKVRSKKSNPGVDLTAMVDLAFLLITFFMLTTTLSKPQSMPLAMPDKTEDPNKPKDDMKIDEYRLMTILIGKDNKLVWYMGKFDEPKIAPTQTAFGKEGIRKAILQCTALAKQHTTKEDEGLIVNIKASDASSYRNLVDILDEMAINHVQLYAIGDITKPEVQYLTEQGLQ